MDRITQIRYLMIGTGIMALLIWVVTILSVDNGYIPAGMEWLGHIPLIFCISNEISFVAMYHREKNRYHD